MTIAEIKKQITDHFISDPTIVQKYKLQTDKTFDDQFSTVSLENIIFFSYGSCILVFTVTFQSSC